MAQTTRPDVPFIHPPEELNDDTKNGLICFMDHRRQCGADCMAYQYPTPEGPDYKGQQWANCSLLVNAHRVGKHIVVLAQLLSRVEADKKRYNQPPVPTVR